MGRDWSIPVACLGDARLFVCPLGPTCPVSAAMQTDWLSADETAQIMTLRHPEHRTRAAQGRAFLRAVLAGALDADPASLHLSRTTRGKPFLVGPGPFFNHARARDRAVVVLSETRAVGVDIEEAGRLPQDSAAFADLISITCRTQEADVVTRTSDPEMAFLRIWTAKEARMKLTGEGLSLAPRDILLSFAAMKPVAFALPQTPDADLTLLDELWPDAVVAVASGPARLHLMA
ncbi:MAG: 4'-phosphopantetheinyl transferase superfamily protein [Rhodobacteraceae bacterium]|jgi:4'-phosphopantetheinyl transferase|nr:4'-phosphopantetheinyl transferase superfamily protein [Paracoccaceae bacterium]